jgi:SHS2 domain-containing protein
MFNYMTPLAGVEERDETTVTVEDAHDLDDLLYRVMDEFFFGFAANLFVCRSVRVVALDRARLCCTAVGRGETFDKARHEQGTEIKAITMHNMHITESPSRVDVFVTVDI